MSVYQIYRLQNLCRYLPWSNNCKLFNEKQLLFLSNFPQKDVFVKKYQTLVTKRIKLKNCVVKV